MEEKKHKRRSIRIKGYDYSQEGMYFLTICTQGRKKILSTINEKNENRINNCRGRSCACPVELSRFGKFVENEMIKINKIYEYVTLEKYVIMPNHIHFIIQIRAGTRPAPTIGEIVGHLKSVTTLRYIRDIKLKFNKRVWQRNYYEHIIRNEKEYWKIYEYIEKNPMKWKLDEYYQN